MYNPHALATQVSAHKPLPCSPAPGHRASLEQALRQEGHRIETRPAPIGTTEWVLLFKR